jgi:hypothetical protein
VGLFLALTLNPELKIEKDEISQGKDEKYCLFIAKKGKASDSLLSTHMLYFIFPLNFVLRYYILQLTLRDRNMWIVLFVLLYLDFAFTSLLGTQRHGFERNETTSFLVVFCMILLLQSSYMKERKQKLSVTTARRVTKLYRIDFSRGMTQGLKKGKTTNLCLVRLSSLTVLIVSTFSPLLSFHSQH